MAAVDTIRFPFVAVILVVAAGGCISVRGDIQTYHPSRDEGTLRHIVLFKFKPEAAPEQVREVENAFRRLPAQIPEIRQFDWGIEMSGRGLNRGFTHGGAFTFKNEAERDAYLNHPAHQEFVALVSPVVAEIFVFDYWAQR